ncbi:succinate dehydrogenase [Mariniphaga sediminis]|jgi:succinate dehydrogenase / fumarate reductase cytochrome b subunit|uniref:Succinate dehydrogenase n=1 Tax=Mariniphaga sediminis TaxID=1628158 RepID=A0A399D472_9BACT|nr:succinate dehydrogenase cytochrome b subunit [Mariniphaga sediminis]MBD3622117.1 succinate dehydrogenase cytochrome b subunit [Sunxiuqinia sp.]RIH66449.1 succinate dehydrogenase [Mariniphaga sediminis]
MSKFLTASIGRKFIMGVSGLFLVVFIAVHLTVNILLIFDDSGELFNQAAHFMGTNPVVKIMEPLLGIGFLVHILWSFFLEYQNWKARPVKYDRKSSGVSSTWTSRNMLVLGALVLVFLIVHVLQFFWVIKFNPESMNSVIIGGEEMEDTYSLVAGLFRSSVAYDLFYIVGGILLGFHLSHGFWSGFQTLGLSNKHWISRLQVLGKIFSVIVAIGFSIIPLYFLIKF